MDIIIPNIDSKGTIHFKDYPDFKPNLTPKQMFEMGSFGVHLLTIIFYCDFISKSLDENIQIDLKVDWKFRSFLVPYKMIHNVLDSLEEILLKVINK